MTPSDDSDIDDSDGFDALMGQLDPPMLVVTTVSDERRAGCLVGFHSQCGIDPRRYAVWISRPNRTYAIASVADTFALHVLESGHGALADLFGARTGDDIDKFDRCAWTPGPDGVPLLDDCPTRIVGRRVSFTDVGADHGCLVLAPILVDRDRSAKWLRLANMTGMTAGHAPDEPRHPR